MVGCYRNTSNDIVVLVDAWNPSPRHTNNMADTIDASSFMIN